MSRAPLWPQAADGRRDGRAGRLPRAAGRRPRGPGARGLRDPGQFAMLAAAERWGGGEDERPYLARAFSIARWRDGRGSLSARGRRARDTGACASCARASRCGCSARSGRASPRRATAGGRCSSEAAWGSRRLAIWQDALEASRDDRPARLSRRPAGARAPRCCEARASPPTTARPATTASSPTCSPRSSSEMRTRSCTRAGRRRCWRPSERSAQTSGVPAQLALEAGMACGFGACYGCVVPKRGGGYLRVCVDGPVIDAAELEYVEEHAGAPA